MSLRLIIEDDEGSTTVVPLTSDAITIGRQQGNTIQLTEKNVSRRHARLYPEADAWVIEDLGSYNGVKVNNDVVDGRTRLREGDVVEIGDYHLAITEDVDKSPLNFRSGQAANDGAAVEPMLVSSSADLPRLSPEEIAALQSGQQPITPPQRGLLVDSGPMPAGHYHPPGTYAEPERGKKTGLFVFLGIVVLGVAGLGVFWAVSTGKGGGSDEVASSAGGKGGEVEASPAKGPALPQPKHQSLAHADDGVAADGGAPSADGGGTPTADGGAAATSSGAAADAGALIDDGEEPLTDDGEDDDDGGSVDVADGPKPNKPKPKPKQPSEPAGDPVQLLADARQAAFTNPGNAFRLAKQSYTIKPTGDALWVMGPAACRLKDLAKVNWVLKRLKGADKTKLRDICAQKGFELP
jgi:pSer/pThr/pTyr-binding forkhead associated (FHA) protein